jgi:ribosomal protein S18 acetylase RimI-like enzyme
MLNYQIIEKLPTPEEYNQLRQLVGWGIYERDVILQALPHSLYCVCAVKDSEIIGMARIIGDGGIAYYIQDVIVKPDCQRQGIGTKLMDKIMDYIRLHANNNSVIGLMAAKSKEPFYTRYGFSIRPDDRLGSGMTMWWKKD